MLIILSLGKNLLRLNRNFDTSNFDLKGVNIHRLYCHLVGTRKKNSTHPKFRLKRFRDKENTLYVILEFKSCPPVFQILRFFFVVLVTL